jgi:excisionase family DNA binding protein
MKKNVDLLAICLCIQNKEQRHASLTVKSYREVGMGKKGRKRSRKQRSRRRKETTLLDCKEVKRRLGVTRDTVYRWLKKGILKGTKVGSVWRVSVHELERFAGCQGEWTGQRKQRILLSTSDAAERLGVCRRTVNRLIQRKKIKARRVGRQWRISETQLEKFIQRSQRRQE